MSKKSCCCVSPAFGSGCGCGCASNPGIGNICNPFCLLVFLLALKKGEIIKDNCTIEAIFFLLLLYCCCCGRGCPTGCGSGCGCGCGSGCGCNCCH